MFSQNFIEILIAGRFPTISNSILEDMFFCSHWNRCQERRYYVKGSTNCMLSSLVKYVRVEPESHLPPPCILLPFTEVSWQRYDEVTSKA